MNNTEFNLSDAIGAIEEVLGGGGEFRMFPKGVSMMPLIRQGKDSVVLRRREEMPARKHDIAFYRRADESFVLHRVMKIKKDGSYVMCGDNQYEFEDGVPADRIIAYVSHVYRQNRRISVRSPLYRLYVFAWTKMPVRKAANKIRALFKGKAK